jgi:hypothetical protein
MLILGEGCTNCHFLKGVKGRHVASWCLSSSWHHKNLGGPFVKWGRAKKNPFVRFVSTHFRSKKEIFHSKKKKTLVHTCVKLVAGPDDMCSNLQVVWSTHLIINSQTFFTQSCILMLEVWSLHLIISIGTFIMQQINHSRVLHPPHPPPPKPFLYSMP